jgi:hypothetical protein
MFQVREALDKVKDAINFMTRGLKLLGSDISTAARLFGKAAMGKFTGIPHVSSNAQRCSNCVVIVVAAVMRTA